MHGCFCPQSHKECFKYTVSAWQIHPRQVTLYGMQFFLAAPKLKIIAGMLTGTYTGGSVNFNAIALEYEFQKKGILYAGTIAVDNVVTAIWIMITLIIPTVLNRIWKGNKKLISNEKKSLNENEENQNIDLTSLAWLLFLGISVYYISDIISNYIINIPSILILTTIGIILAQSKFISNFFFFCGWIF